MENELLEKLFVNHPPSAVQQFLDERVIETLLKATGAGETHDTLDPDRDDDVSLPQFMRAIANPDTTDPVDTKQAVIHSHQCAAHLGLCKLAILADDDVKAHQHLNKAMQHFCKVHSAVHRQASE
jgi:hypothetical protein